MAARKKTGSATSASTKKATRKKASKASEPKKASTSGAEGQTAPGTETRAPARKTTPARKTKARAKTQTKPKEAAPQPRARSRTKAAASRQTERDFPTDFLWGAATSATQIDGGDENTDWLRFSQEPGRIADSSTPLEACDHWNRYADDYRLLRDLGCNAYRLGVDWSRFQAAPDAELNQAALEHLRGMLQNLRDLGIRPLLTLHHFTLPQWVQAAGGFTRAETADAFLKFVQFIAEGAGDLVSEYVTFNEPNVYAMQGYVQGVWPPGKRGLSGYLDSMKVQRRMLLAHFRAYDAIREIHGRRNYAAPQIGIAKHMRVFDPVDPNNRLDVDRRNSADFRFNRLFSDCVQSGRLLQPLGRGEQVHDGRAWDFFGLNYYTRDLVAFSLRKPGSLFIDLQTKADAPKNDLGWEIYPEGLYRLLVDVHQRYGLPVRVTENGIADADDDQRPAFLHAHLAALARALRKGVRVDGYYHWSLLDNFEWAEGYTARFGLARVDFTSQARSLRPSAELYRRIILEGRLPDRSIP